MNLRDVVILNGSRTPWAEYAGTRGFGRLRDVSAIDLAAAAARGAMERSKVDPAWIDQVVIGNVMQTSADAVYGARHVGLKAGCRVEVPALTVNRLCGSGLEAGRLGAQWLAAGESEFVLAGGMESMSQAPYVLRGARGRGLPLGGAPVLEDSLFQALRDTFCGLMMAQTAEKLAAQYGIPRAAQDEYALRSHRQGVRAVQEGIFNAEIVPVTAPGPKGPAVVDADDHLKPDTTLEALAALKPSFGPTGTVTAGNASGIVDGAACVVMTTAARAKERGLAPLGRWVASAAVGVPPDLMGIGPAPAIREALRRAVLGLDAVDLFEINEAFAGQYLAVEKELGLDPAKVNVNGGSIALGHPLGATGTRLLLTLLLELRRRKIRIGVASACIGGGQGIAAVVEAL